MQKWKSRSPATIAIGLSIAALVIPVAAAQTFDEVHRKAKDYIAYIDADLSKTALCRSYLGRTVTLTSFDLLASRLTGAGAKGEFETTAQFQARQAGASLRQPAGAIILSIPIDRNYVRYDADAGAMNIYSGAFQTGPYSDAIRAELAAFSAISTYSLPALPRSQVRVGETIRVLDTAVAHSVSGIPIRITNAERHTKGLLLSAEHLFGFARDKNSTVIGFDISQAVAPRLKQSLRTAIVIEPQSPYVITGSMNGEAATARTPVHYTERVTIISAKPMCGLVMDAQSKVLATADAGLK